ncbi:MAG TPA: hypothetical protein VIU11_26770 [Nakamurella sp.]
MRLELRLRCAETFQVALHLDRGVDEQVDVQLRRHLRARPGRLPMVLDHLKTQGQTGQHQGIAAGVAPVGDRAEGEIHPAHRGIVGAVQHKGADVGSGHAGEHGASMSLRLAGRPAARQGPTLGHLLLIAPAMRSNSWRSHAA